MCFLFGSTPDKLRDSRSVVEQNDAEGFCFRCCEQAV
jgi:hypothetical protein